MNSAKLQTSHSGGTDAGNYKERKVKYKNLVYFPERKETYRIRM